MTGAPATVDERQLRELGVTVIAPAPAAQARGEVAETRDPR